MSYEGGGEFTLAGYSARSMLELRWCEILRNVSTPDKRTVWGPLTWGGGGISDVHHKER